MLWKLYEKFPSIQKEYGEIQPLVLHTTSPNFLITSKKLTVPDVRRIDPPVGA